MPRFSSSRSPRRPDTAVPVGGLARGALDDVQVNTMAPSVRVGDLVIPAGLLDLNPHLARAARPCADRSQAPTVAPVTARSSVDLVVTLPGLALVSEANARETVRARIRRVRHERTTLLAPALAPHRPLPAPLFLTVVRCGPKVFDRDNLAGSAKHLTDAVAAWAHLDDGDPESLFVRADQEITAARAVHLYLHHGAWASPPACPWTLTPHALECWVTRFCPEADWPAARAALARLAPAAVLVEGLRTRDGRRLYRHPDHPTARFLVAWEPDGPPRLVAVAHEAAVRARPRPPRGESAP